MLAKRHTLIYFRKKPKNENMKIWNNEIMNLGIDDQDQNTEIMDT